MPCCSGRSNETAGSSVGLSPAAVAAWRALTPLQARVVHPQVGTVFVVEDDPPCSVSAARIGVALSEVRRRVRSGASALPAPVVAEWIRDAAAGVSALRRANGPEQESLRLHPSVILIDEHGRAWLDRLASHAFEEIRRTDSVQSGSRSVGVFRYMPPERLGEPANVAEVGAGDVFVLGCIAAELLTGRHPFHGSDELSTIHAILRGEPDFRGDLSEPAVAVLRRAVFVEPRERWPDALAFAGELSAAHGSALPGDAAAAIAAIAGTELARQARALSSAGS